MFTTTELDVATISKLIKCVVEVKRKGYGYVTITVVEGKITEIETVIKDRNIND
jgi:hypothetical protein